jgi:hypothetical protein
VAAAVEAEAAGAAAVAAVSAEAAHPADGDRTISTSLHCHHQEMTSKRCGQIEQNDVRERKFPSKKLNYLRGLFQAGLDF